MTHHGILGLKPILIYAGDPPPLSTISTHLLTTTILGCIIKIPLLGLNCVCSLKDSLVYHGADYTKITIKIQLGKDAYLVTFSPNKNPWYILMQCFQLCSGCLLEHSRKCGKWLLFELKLSIRNCPSVTVKFFNAQKPWILLCFKECCAE